MIHEFGEANSKLGVVSGPLLLFIMAHACHLFELSRLVFPVTPIMFEISGPIFPVSSCRAAMALMECIHYTITTHYLVIS